VTSDKKATSLVSLGACLEYYDFIIFALMAETFGHLFFPADQPIAASIKALGVFALGYLARPLGGVFLGALGDRFGRKYVFINVMMVMAISTFAIGLLPTYATIGNAAPFLLVLCRIIQGISFGAEVPGAMTIVAEFAKPSKQGVFAGFVVSSLALGSLLASSLLYILTSLMSQEAFLHFAWRIPFILGGILAVFSYVLRKELQETPIFLKEKGEVKAKRSYLTKADIPKVIIGIGMTFAIASLVVFFLYLPAFLSVYYKYPLKSVYFAMTIAIVWSMIISPITGLFADRVNKRILYILTSFVVTFALFPLFASLFHVNLTFLVFTLCLYQTFISLLSVCYFPLIASIFQPLARYTGIAASYGIGYCLMGLLPMAATWLISLTGTPMSGVLLLAFFTVVGAVSGYLIPLAK